MNLAVKVLRTYFLTTGSRLRAGSALAWCAGSRAGKAAISAERQDERARRRVVNEHHLSCAEVVLGVTAYCVFDEPELLGRSKLNHPFPRAGIETTRDVAEQDFHGATKNRLSETVKPPALADIGTWDQIR